MAIYAATMVRSAPGNNPLEVPPKLQALALISPMSPIGGFNHDPRLGPNLERLPPTLVVTGTNDRFCPPDLASSLADLIKDSKLITVKGADHFYGGYEEEAASAAITFMADLLKI